MLVHSDRDSSFTDEDREKAEDAWWRVALDLMTLVPQRVLMALSGLLPK